MTNNDPDDPVLVHLCYLREAVDGVNARLDIQNDRIRLTETDLAVLKDRQSEARTSGGKWGAGAGAFVGGAIVAVYQYFGGK